MAAKERHDSRVHLVASLPSLIHCSAVPRWLWKATMRSAGPCQVGDDEAEAGTKFA